jgi:hypothetical protein
VTTVHRQITLKRLAVPYCPYDLDDLLARLGGIGVIALKTRGRRESLKKSDLVRFVFACAFDTEYMSVGFG